MRRLLDDGLSALADLLQSGGGSCPPETEERLRTLSEAWEDAGLHTGSSLLGDIARTLAERRHGGNRDPLALMALTDRAVRYTRYCQQKCALDDAGAALGADQDKEDTHETTA